MLTPLRLELLDLEVRRSWTARFAATAGVLFGLLAGVILQDLQIRDGVGERIAKARLDAAWSKGVQVGEIGVPDFRATSERDDGANERIAPSLDVCDVSIAKLAVTKRFADCGHVDPEAPLLNGYIGPDVIHQLLLRDDLAWAVGKMGQNIQRPIPEEKHSTVAPKHPLANRKFKRAEPQLPVNYGAIHVC